MPLRVSVCLGIRILMLTKQVFEARDNLVRGKGHIPFHCEIRHAALLA